MNQELFNYHYDGTIRDENLTTVLDILNQTLPFRYHVQADGRIHRDHEDRDGAGDALGRFELREKAGGPKPALLRHDHDLAERSSGLCLRVRYSGSVAALKLALQELRDEGSKWG